MSILSKFGEDASTGSGRFSICKDGNLSKWVHVIPAACMQCVLAAAPSRPAELSTASQNSKPWREQTNLRKYNAIIMHYYIIWCAESCWCCNAREGNAVSQEYIYNYIHDIFIGSGAIIDPVLGDFYILATLWIYIHFVWNLDTPIFYKQPPISNLASEEANLIIPAN